MNNMAPEPPEGDDFSFELKQGGEKALGKQATGLTTGDIGVWGGMTERERRALLEKRGGRPFFEAASKPEDTNTENTE
jgi:hypothetical protein